MKNKENVQLKAVDCSKCELFLAVFVKKSKFSAEVSEYCFDDRIRISFDFLKMAEYKYENCSV